MEKETSIIASVNEKGELVEEQTFEISKELADMIRSEVSPSFKTGVISCTEALKIINNA